ncbi:hypothetical protein HOLleu_29975 [Holothuria leucospilota]|uniref:Uncharacterized protein n=1 Tax=Holothuria leucospilota TaxID=206669 RepID=A0A9Q1BJU7_HOLLE|nr:hypothetical protein HOLleu_29975 [Holothuria leucospilota]
MPWCASRVDNPFFGGGQWSFGVTREVKAQTNVGWGLGAKEVILHQLLYVLKNMQECTRFTIFLISMSSYGYLTHPSEPPTKSAVLWTVKYQENQETGLAN